MASVGLGSSKPAWYFAAILGLGLGFVLTPLMTTMQMAAPHNLIALSSGAFICSRTFGASIALPISTSIFTAQMAKRLPAAVAKAVLPLGLSPEKLPLFIAGLRAEHIDAIAKIPGVTPQMIEVGHHAFQESFALSARRMWGFPLALS